MKEVANDAFSIGSRPCDFMSDTDQSSSEYVDERPVSVRFCQVTIREYNLTIGDNPACSGGAPIRYIFKFPTTAMKMHCFELLANSFFLRYHLDSLDWEYSPDHKIVPVDEYEKRRKPRSHSELIMSPYTRYRLLLHTLEVPITTISEVTTELKQIRESRQRTAEKFLKQSNCDRWKVGASIKKIFTFRKTKRELLNAQTRRHHQIFMQFKTLNEPIEYGSSISDRKDQLKNIPVAKDRIEFNGEFTPHLRLRDEALINSHTEESFLSSDHPLRSLVYTTDG